MTDTVWNDALAGCQKVNTMSSTVMIFKYSDDMAAHAADRVIQVTLKAIEARGRVMLALAGG